MPYQFKNDYSELAHPRIIEALAKYNSEQNIPYGEDYHSENAKKRIREIFSLKEDTSIHFLSGGTQTNMVLISSALRHYEGVLACNSGHINVHETASVEGAGYKIYTVKGNNAKLSASDIYEAIRHNNNEHMVKIKMVYISNSTEYGTIYNREELIEIYNACKENDLYLFIDGARLGSALTCKENDIKNEDLGLFCDAFYIGGTKNGLLFGEALVINNKELQKDFRYHIKNKGAMLAKGYALGIQFEEMFKDNLYFELAEHANKMAERIRDIFDRLSIPYLNAPTNQVFPTFSRDIALSLIDRYGLEIWEDNNEKMIVRFVTSFLTKEEDIVELDQYLSRLFSK